MNSETSILNTLCENDTPFDVKKNLRAEKGIFEAQSPIVFLLINGGLFLLGKVVLFLYFTIYVSCCFDY
ncbi:MAG: hypothetical protein AUK31_01115 [Fibrobacteres bacterium CG2_30_45_31]|nr:MAG: hypothetical protein AUK31_01115 [Fibrobacteres bacterium CG2_30_45_31]